MLVSLGLVGLVLRAGLAIRRARLGRIAPPPHARARHLRLAPLAVAMVWLGLVGGLGSALWLRGFGVLSTFHGLVGVTAATLFALAAWQGRRLRGGEHRAREAHALLGAGAALLAAVAAIAGFVLLP